MLLGVMGEAGDVGNTKNKNPNLQYSYASDSHVMNEMHFGTL